MVVPFNQQHYTGKELQYIQDCMNSGRISGDGKYTTACQQFFEGKYHFKKTFLTTSCTDALEMAALLLQIEPGDEVIAPSYAFVSTVNPFVLRGAKIIFADSLPDHPNADINHIKSLISPRTKAVVVVHYAGVAVDMDPLLTLSEKHGFAVVEDAAQAIDAYYKGRALGGIGNFGAFSFHETKNIVSGEGGLLVVNDPDYIQRAEIIREKGTNRTAFFRGQADRYGWTDIGSSFLPSDMIAAFLYAQLESLESIQAKRMQIWSRYAKALSPLMDSGYFAGPQIPSFASNNAHVFYIVLPSLQHRTELMSFLKKEGISAVFHYLSLHKSPYFGPQYTGEQLPNSDRFSDCLLRLPLFFDMTTIQQDYVIGKLLDYYS